MHAVSYTFHDICIYHNLPSAHSLTVPVWMPFYWCVTPVHCLDHLYVSVVAVHLVDRGSLLWLQPKKSIRYHNVIFIHIIFKLYHLVILKHIKYEKLGKLLSIIFFSRVLLYILEIDRCIGRSAWCIYFPSIVYIGYIHQPTKYLIYFLSIHFAAFNHLIYTYNTVAHDVA